jgi:tetratricopeptide (TPR) repeat protein
MLWVNGKRWLPGICALGLLVSGCDLLNRTTGDEEREPHYVRGLNWKIQGQTDKAIESFSRSLQTNPNSAAAHLALGDLHYHSTGKFIVAAYHYGEFLRLKSATKTGYRDQTVEDLIKNCELQIAAKYANAVARQENQVALESLRLEVAGLREENRVLKRMAGIASLSVTPTNPPPPAPRAAQPAPSQAPAPRQSAVTAPPSSAPAAPGPSAGPVPVEWSIWAPCPASNGLLARRSTPTER